MKLLRRSIAVLGLVLAFSSGVLASESSPAVSVVSADEASVSKDAASVELKLTLEFRYGLFAWRKVFEGPFLVREGSPSTIRANFVNEPYAAVINVRGQKLTGHSRENAWALELLRQDTSDDSSFVETDQARLILDAGGAVRANLKGSYQLQRRDLRVTLEAPAN